MFEDEFIKEETVVSEEIFLKDESVVSAEENIDKEETPVLFRIDQDKSNSCNLEDSFGLPLLGYDGQVPLLSHPRSILRKHLQGKTLIVKTNLKGRKVLVNPNNGKRVEVKSSNSTIIGCGAPQSQDSNSQSLLITNKQKLDDERRFSLSLISGPPAKVSKKNGSADWTNVNQALKYASSTIRDNITVDIDHNYFSKVKRKRIKKGFTTLSQGNGSYVIQEVPLIDNQSSHSQLPKEFTDRDTQTDRQLVDRMTQTEPMTIITTPLPQVRILNNTESDNSDLLFSSSELPVLTDLGDVFHSLQVSNNSPSTNQSFVEPWKKLFFYDLKHCHKRDASGNLPLHIAVIQDNLNHVKRQCVALHAHKVNINVLNGDLLTALQLAMLHNSSVEIVRVLLSNNADMDILDGEGNNILHHAVVYGNIEVVQLLVTKMLNKIDSFNYEGYTPLMLSVIYKMHKKAEALLSEGVNPNLGDMKSGRTALFHAVENNDIQMVKLLLAFKAETKVKNFFGTSPHDAMYELDSINIIIKQLILKRYSFGVTTKKKRNVDETSKTSKGKQREKKLKSIELS